MSPPGVCSPNTAITDYAYPLSHPLRNANFPTSDRASVLSEEVDLFDESYDDSLAHTYLTDEINRRAVALFDFEPENDNEVPLREGQVIWISYRHGQGWLVAEDPELGENGLVPEEYVDIFYTDETEDVPKPFMPRILQELRLHDDSDWEDTDDEDVAVLPLLEEQMENTRLE